MRTAGAFRFCAGVILAIFLSGGAPTGTTRQNGPDAIGTVSLLEDHTLVFRLNVTTVTGNKIDELRCGPESATYQALKTLAGDIRVRETRPIPPWPNSIGIAMMAADRTLTVYNRATTKEGDGIFLSVYPTDSRNYAAMIEHIGGIEPNETKPVPPYPPSIGVATMAADEL
jgi:hypothetical protein